MKSAYLTKAASKPGRQRTSQVKSYPAPIGGWNTACSLVAPVPATARRLDNWRPTSTGIAMRGGNVTHATVSVGGAAVSFASFNPPTNKKLFACTTDSIFDVTTVADPGVVPTAAVSGQTNGYYSYVNFTTSGGEFLVMVNGHDPMQQYDAVGGWKQITDSSTPAITGLETSKLSFVWPYRNRLFFIQAASLNVKYLPVGAVAGALGNIDLNGVAIHGGALIAGGTWSQDTGDGLDDKIVFLTDQGEVIIYQGSNPADASDWKLVGRYDSAKPLGPRAMYRMGGDLVILTEIGAIPVSALVANELAKLNLIAPSAPIHPDWRREAQARRALPWESEKWTEMSYVMVSVPSTQPGQDPLCFVMNTETGSWCRYTNWDARCIIVHNGKLYFGTNDGRVCQGEVGGKDGDQGIYYTCVSNPEQLGAPSYTKTIQEMRATFYGNTPFNPLLSASMDYKVELPSPPDSADDSTSTWATSQWDTGLWDQAVWDAQPDEESAEVIIESIGRTGFAVQWQVQITGATVATPNRELIAIDLSHDMGGTPL